ncbi:hypothetical protein H7I76_05340 [Mycolicibacterium vaccae]|nr:hypothetical protein [Mycolicibacterium vaccae]
MSPSNIRTPDWGESVQMIGSCDFDPPADIPRWLDDIEQPIVLALYPLSSKTTWVWRSPR